MYTCNASLSFNADAISYASSYSFCFSSISLLDMLVICLDRLIISLKKLFRIDGRARKALLSTLPCKETYERSSNFQVKSLELFSFNSPHPASMLSGRRKFFVLYLLLVHHFYFLIPQCIDDSSPYFTIELV